MRARVFVCVHVCVCTMIVFVMNVCVRMTVVIISAWLHVCVIELVFARVRVRARMRVCVL